jgi:hypothetical protein
MYYSIVGFLFWAIFLVQVPYIENYFGGRQVMFYIVMSYGVSSNLVRIFLVWYYGKYRTSTGKVVLDLMQLGVVLSSVVIVMYPTMMSVVGTREAEGPSGHPVGFWVCIALTTMMGGVNSFLITAGYNLMSVCPPKSVSYFLVGQTVTPVMCWPVLIALRMIVVAITGGDAEQVSFLVAVISLGGAGVLTVLAIPLYRFKTRFHPDIADILNQDDGDLLEVKKVESGVLRNESTMFGIFKLIWAPATAVWLTNFLTYMVYPGQVNTWSPSYDTLYESVTYRSFLIYIYSVADMLGRLIIQWSPALLKLSSDYRIVGVSIGRGALLATLFVLSSARIDGVVISSDVFRLVLVTLLGFSYGIVFAIANHDAPSRISVDNKFKSGTFISLMVVNGMLFGSLAGLGIKMMMPE